MLKKLLWVLLVIGTYVTATEPPLPKLMVLTEDLPPLQITENNILVDGIAFHAVRHLLDSSELNYSIDVMPWARAYKIAREQPNVLLFSLVRTPHRENAFHWLTRIADMDMYLVSAKTAQVGLTTLEEARKVLIGVKRNDVVYEYLSANGFVDNQNLLIMRDTQDTYDALINHRVQLAPANPELINAYCKLSGCNLESFRFNVLMPDMHQDFYLAASMGTDPRILKRIRQTIVATGELAAK